MLSDVWCACCPLHVRYIVCSACVKLTFTVRLVVVVCLSLHLHACVCGCVCVCVFAAQPQYKRGHRKTASFGTILDIPEIVVTGIGESMAGMASRCYVSSCSDMDLSSMLSQTEPAQTHVFFLWGGLFGFI